MKCPIFQILLALATLAPVALAEPDPLSPAKAKALRTRFETRQRDTTSWTATFTSAPASCAGICTSSIKATVQFCTTGLLAEAGTVGTGRGTPG